MNKKANKERKPLHSFSYLLTNRLLSLTLYLVCMFVSFILSFRQQDQIGEF